MEPNAFISALLYGAVGVLFFALGIPLAMGKIPPNHWYGFRTAKTLGSSQTWYAANQVAGQDMMIAGAVILCGIIAISIVKTFAAPGLPVRGLGLALLCLATIGAVAHSFSSLARL